MTTRTDPRVRRPLSLWVWPAVGIVLVAVSGTVFGLLGAIVSAAAGCCAAVFTAAETLDEDRSTTRRRGTRALLVGFAAAVVVSAVFLAQGALPWARQQPADQPSNPANGPVDLRGKRVTQADVERSDLRGALLAGADLSALNLDRRPLDGASAPGALFRGANLSGASLQRVDLRGADLTDACLNGADFIGTVRDGTRGLNLTGAVTTSLIPGRAPPPVDRAALPAACPR